MSTNGTIRCGIGGWVYPPWRGTFYPKQLKQAEELAYASRRLSAIEINGTFYRLQTPQTYRHWRDQTPDGFVFSLKGPRFITHRRDFSEIGPFLDRFVASGPRELGPRLGPILWQFAATLRFDAAVFAGFLERLPGGLRHAVEVRHASFADPAFAELLRRHKVALAWVDDADYPAFDAVTTDFVYARLQRCEAAEPTGYPEGALDAFAARFQAQAAAGRDCFVYFINGAKVRAPAAAEAFIRRLGAS